MSQLCYCPAARRMPGMLAGIGLPTPHDSVDVVGIELEPVAGPPGAFGRDYRRAAPKEAVEHDVAACGGVQDRVSDQPHWFYRRVQCEQVAFLARRAGTRIVPDVGAIASILAELDIVALRCAAVLEHENEFVAAAIEGSHAGVVFDPNTYVLEFGIDASACGKQLTDVPPIRKDKVERSICAVASKQRACLDEESSVLGLVHLAGGHREVGVVDRAEAADVALQ